MTDADDTTGGDLPFLLGRLLFGGLLAYMGVQNLRRYEERVGYAEAMDVPKAGKLVPFASGGLVAGGVGIALWRAPRLAAAAVAAFLLGVTPTLHDFWNREGEERDAERVQFLKNAALLGAAIAFVGIGDRRSR